MNPDRAHLLRRLPVLATAVATVAALLCARVVWLGAVVDAESLSEAPVVELRAPRGALWDRDGALIAAETYRYEVGVAPPAVTDPLAFAEAVAPVLGLPATEVRDRVSDPGQRWALLARSVDAAAAERLEAMDLDGLFLTPLPRRTYPLAETAAHVTGFVNMDGEASYGVEAAYDAELTGRPGRLTGALGTVPQGFQPATGGVDLILSIDRELQAATYASLAHAVEDETALGGTALVIDPRTGSILAMASVPTYDPNRYYEAELSAFLNPATSMQYEPGSVVKAMTMAIALEAGAVSPSSTYVDEGAAEYGGIYVSNWDRSVVGDVTMTELLGHSLNVGAMHIADLTGPEAFYRGIAEFGFGSPTGIDLPNEAIGLVRSPDDPTWYPADLATNSFGQGMAATPLQVAVAMSAIANNGVMMVPRVVEGRMPPGGVPERLAPQVARQVVTPETARAVRSMLLAAVDEIIHEAAIPGYYVAGKTGTSQIPIAGGYDEDGTVASFCGFLPADDPKVLVLVKLDRPETPQGSDAAAPVFREIAEAAIAALNIPPDDPGAVSGTSWSP